MSLFLIYLLLLLLVLVFADMEPACDRLTNSAFVFVKPHANTQATRNLVAEKLTEAGVKILSESDIDGKEIDEKSLIDNHYYSIASKATILPAEEIPVPADRFEQAFGESWKLVLKEKRACNAMEACEKFGCTPMELNDAWRQAEEKSQVQKFGGGFYCGRISVNDKPEVYVFNAFFMSMRSKFVGEGKAIHCYVVEWDPRDLSWSSFRNDILGPTDPSIAKEGSIRRTIFETYQRLGLTSIPNKSDNGVHASASPFEGLAEKCNWLGVEPQDDPFGKALLEAGIQSQRIAEWFKDPQVQTTDSSKGSLFDTLEDMNVDECLQKLTNLNDLNSAK